MHESQAPLGACDSCVGLYLRATRASPSLGEQGNGKPLTGLTISSGQLIHGVCPLRGQYPVDYLPLMVILSIMFLLRAGAHGHARVRGRAGVHVCAREASVAPIDVNEGYTPIWLEIPREESTFNRARRRSFKNCRWVGVRICTWETGLCTGLSSRRDYMLVRA